MRAQNLLLASLLTTVLGSTALAGDLAPDESHRREALDAIHRLGSDAHQLRFDGENASRVWPIYATVDQTASRARVHIAYSNAISVMPEASTISVSLNDTPVAQTALAAGEAVEIVTPTGGGWGAQEVA